MIITNKNGSIRFTGRWDLTESGTAVTTAPGAMIEFAFVGILAVLKFDTGYLRAPYPHLWVIVDDGAKIEVPVDAFLRLETKNYGNHYVKIIFKSAQESCHRWYLPLESKVALEGIEVEAEGELPADNRKTIEFIGDSITEGVLIDDFRQPIESYDQLNRPYQDDVTATYAYLTSQKLDINPIIMGYGGVGITTSGAGSVPKASESYLYYYAGSPAEPANADITVINYGANDQGIPNVQDYILEYYNFLKIVRERNLKAKIVVLGAFCGFASDELAQMVQSFNNKENDNVIYINTKGWIPTEPLHPQRGGHQTIAEYLSEELKKLL